MKKLLLATALLALLTSAACGKSSRGGGGGGGISSAVLDITGASVPPQVAEGGDIPGTPSEDPPGTQKKTIPWTKIEDIATIYYSPQEEKFFRNAERHPQKWMDLADMQIKRFRKMMKEYNNQVPKPTKSYFEIATIRMNWQRTHNCLREIFYYAKNNLHELKPYLKKGSCPDAVKAGYVSNWR